MKRLIALLLFLGILLPASAQNGSDHISPVDTTRYPTYVLVSESDIPPLDRLELARRFQGISTESTTIASDVVRSIGDRESFYIVSIEGGGVANVPTELRFTGDHIYVWVETGIVYDEQNFVSLATGIDTQIYELVRNLWGNEPNPGIDGETRLHIVITQRLRNNLAGYYANSNGYPSEVVANSNERELLILSSYLLTQTPIRGMSFTAHEFHHMIQHTIDSNEANWLNEGLSSFTEYVLGFDQQTALLNEFARFPSTSLTHWGLGSRRLAEYGAPMLFLIYLHDHYGLEAVQAVANDSDTGLVSIDNMLQARNEDSVEVIFADWVMANLLREEGGRYGYQNLVDITPMDLRANVLNLPSVFSFDLDQYATHYYQYQFLPDSLQISLQMPDTVPLIPVNATSGSMLWYSQRADSSNPRLTHAFDLRNVQEAQVNFNIWYELENEWDYGYVSVSTDHGQTWEIQSTNYTTTANSNGRAYGAGYTGQSQIWLADSLSLNAYVGQEILLRFEMVTDEGINLSGIALDDIRLEAIGYQSDFEADGGGWTGEGWIHTDNRLPQRAWLQIVEQSTNENTVHRYLVNGNQQLQFDIQDSTESIYLVLSPFAPMTSQPMTYTLQVE